jgi:lysyl endopeptidase
MKKSTFLLLFLFIAIQTKAQLSEGGIPVSFNSNFKSELSQTDVPVQKMETVDREELLREDAAEKDVTKAYRFAKTFPVNFSTKNSGKWDMLDDGSRLWRLGIESTDAFSVNIIFDQYKLPEGAKVFLYNVEKDNILGGFNSSNNSDDESLAVYPVYGDKIYIELFVPKNVLFEPELRIGQVGHDYTGTFGRPVNNVNSKESGSCNIDVNCPEGDDWKDEKKSVCRLLIDGEFLCTATLLNNTKRDWKPYVITAFHCVDHNPNTKNIIFDFNYEKTTCKGNTNANKITISGCTLKATINKLDFSLYEMKDKLPASYKAYYAGWDATGKKPTKVTGIHHPRGDLKKICVSAKSISVANYGDGYDRNTHWKVPSWDKGITEEGASGSAIFDQNSRVIGDLTGGSSGCDNIKGDDLYARLSNSWNDYPKSSQQLKFWLDPDNTGVLTLDGSYITTLGVTNNEKDTTLSASISPNPFNDVLNITLNDSNFDNPPTVFVYNTTGLLVQKKTLNSNENKLDLKDLSSGVYFVNINDKNKSFVTKIIKQ